MNDEIEEAKRAFYEAKKRLDDALARERTRVVPDAVTTFLRELSAFADRLPRRRADAEPWFTSTTLAGYELPRSLVDAFRGARTLQGIRPELDKLSGGTLGSVLGWICTRHSDTRALTCDQATRGQETRHEIGDFIVRRRHDGPRLIRLRIEARAPAPRPNVVPLDEAQRAGLKERAAFLKS